jgi:hypothetical protein
MYPNQNDTYYDRFDNRPTDNEQSQQVTTGSVQGQNQHLIIRRSHNVNIAQGQGQALLSLEASLQAAIEGILAIFDAQEDINDVELQQLLQELKVIQSQKEIIAIDCSDDINIVQAQVQIDAVVQAVIQLLIKITAKIAEA